MSDLEKALAPLGMLVLGSANTDEGTVTLIGNAGSAMWHVFANARSSKDALLDDWTKAVLNPIAAQFGLEARYPYDRPYPPMLTWAAAAGVGKPSPLGLMIHPTYGLWHAYRAAFIGPITVSETPMQAHPCDSCADKPCLSACPVGAFTADGYDVEACRTHIASVDETACMANACNARRACPIGAGYRYEPAHAQFHMRAFVPD